MIAAVVQAQCLGTVLASEARLAHAVAFGVTGVAVCDVHAYAVVRAVVGANARRTTLARKSCVTKAHAFPADAIATALFGAGANLALVAAETILATTAAVHAHFTRRTHHRAVGHIQAGHAIGGVGRENRVI